MLTVDTVDELRAALAPARRAGSRIGLVATMGALHDGHVSLLDHARRDCDAVVMSLFVNPRQFGDPGDLTGYPRTERHDAELAAAAGVDVLFAPQPDAVYPPGFATAVSVAGPALGLEGEQRGSAHFDGVATVVTKLLNMVGPAVAYFGQKDAQQAAVVRQLVRDLDIPTEIQVRPTVRDSDGLALSSRNARLSADQRLRAPALYRALESVRAAVAGGERDPRSATAEGRALLAAAGAEVEYLQLVDPETMLTFEHDRAIDRDTLAVVAARIGSVRLIDNLPVPVRFAVRSIEQAATCPERGIATPSGAPTA